MRFLRCCFTCLILKRFFSVLGPRLLENLDLRGMFDDEECNKLMEAIEFKKLPCLLVANLRGLGISDDVKVRVVRSADLRGVISFGGSDCTDKDSRVRDWGRPAALVTMDRDSDSGD